MTENMKTKISFSNNDEKVQLPKRTIQRFEDLRKRIELMPWREEVKQSVLLRVSKYPEASLDYVWKNLHSFMTHAINETSGIVIQPQEAKQEIKVENRPSLDGLIPDDEF